MPNGMVIGASCNADPEEVERPQAHPFEMLRQDDCDADAPAEDALEPLLQSTPLQGASAGSMMRDTGFSMVLLAQVIMALIVASSFEGQTLGLHIHRMVAADMKRRCTDRTPL